MFICESNKSKQQYTHNTHKCFDFTNSESNGKTQKAQQLMTYMQYGTSQFITICISDINRDTKDAHESTNA